MLQFITQGGPYMNLILLCGIIVVILSIKKYIEVFVKTPPENLPRLEIGINAIPFWGVMSILLGVFAHFHGVYLAMQAIAAANDISPAIVSQGYAISLITILTGLFIFMVSALSWFFLHWKYKKLLKG